MRKLLILMAFCLSFGVARADVLNVTVGPLSLQIPFQNLNVVYLFDALHANQGSNAQLVGAETTILTLKKINGTFGGVTSVTGQATPYIGFDTVISPEFLSVAPVDVGVWGGRDFTQSEWRAGLKASINIF